MRLLVFTVCSLMAAAIGAPVWACVGPPSHMYLGHYDSVESAEWIALVQAVRGEDGAEARLRVIEYIKGSGPGEITLGELVNVYEWGRDADRPLPGNYFAHTTSDFWDTGGRGYNSTDCRIYPEFQGGQHYLVFGPLDYNLGYENIALAADDAWLGFVRDVVAGQATHPEPVRLADYLGEAEAVIRVRARLDDGVVRIDEEVLHGAGDAYLGMTTIYPDQWYRHALDPACSLHWNGPAANVDEIIVIERIPDEPVLQRESYLCRSPEQIPTTQRGNLSSVNLRARGIFARNAYKRFTIEDGGMELNAERPFRGHRRSYVLQDSSTPEHVSLVQFLQHLPEQGD